MQAFFKGPYYDEIDYDALCLEMSAMVGATVDWVLEDDHVAFLTNGDPRGAARIIGARTARIALELLLSGEL